MSPVSAAHCSRQTTSRWRRDHLPMQNWLKMESSKSSVVVLPTISPTALAAMRKSIATSSSVASPRSASSVRLGRGARAVQRVLMPRVDHHLQHLGLDFAGPDQFLDGVLQRFNPLPAQTANIHDERVTGVKPLQRRRPRRRQIPTSPANPFCCGRESAFCRRTRPNNFHPPPSAARWRRGRAE